MKNEDRGSESEKKFLRRILGQKCREIITLARSSDSSDYILVCDFDRIDENCSALIENGYKEAEKNVFTARKHGKIFSLYLTSREEKTYYILKSFSEYLASSDKHEKKFAYFKGRLLENFTDEKNYEAGKIGYINREFKNSVAWHFLGKRITVSETVSKAKYQCRGTEYELNVGISDKRIFGLPVKAYVMGVKKGVRKFSGKIIAVIFRESGEIEFVATSLNKIYYEPDVADALSDVFETLPETICLYEKSCGAVVYKRTENGIYYLLIKNRSRNVGFPKGHVERGENELETAAREIKEETNVTVKIDKNFRIAYNYMINFFIKKQAVYYVAEIVDGDISVPKEEILDYSFVPYNEAMALLSYPNEKKILKSANQYVKNHSF